MTGLSTALNEITLVFFTTLAPSGVFAFMIMGAVLVIKQMDDDRRKRINRFLCIPLFVAMVGLVASATHLGNPANALYVFMGVGRSPLSTEVFCAVIFLLLAGLYWLYSFFQEPHVTLQKVWMVFNILAGALFITTIAFAYSVETIISWNTFYAPLNLWLNALIGGPVLALLSFQVAKVDSIAKQIGVPLCILSAISLALNTVSLGIQGFELSSLINSFGTAADLVPAYSFFVALFLMCCAGGITCFWLHLRKKTLPKLYASIIACVVIFVGIFIVRFLFYMMHMTVGLGI